MSIKPAAETWQAVASHYLTQPQPFDEDLAADIARILSEAGFSPPVRLLEAGCGSGHLSLLLRKAGYETDLLDFSELALTKAKESYQAAFGNEGPSRFLCGDLMKLPEALSNQQYDVVWNSGVLEHFSKDALAVALGQMKKAASRAVLFIVPNPASLIYLAYRAKMLAAGRWDVGVEFLRDDYAAVVEACGMKLAAHGYCGRQFTNQWLEYVLENPADRQWFEQILKSGQAAAQTLYLQYFVCLPDAGKTSVPIRLDDDRQTLDRTFYMDAIGSANAMITQCQENLKAAEERKTQLQKQLDTIESLHHDNLTALRNERDLASSQFAACQRKIADIERVQTAMYTVLTGIRSEAVAIADLLESWKLNKSFRVARFMQLIERELLRNTWRNRARFIHTTLLRMLGSKQPISEYNALETPRQQAMRIATIADSAMRDPALLSTIASTFQPGTSTGLSPAQPYGRRSICGTPRRSVVYIVNTLFMDLDGKDLMCGGAERYVIELCRIIRDLGYTPEVYQCGNKRWERTYDGVRVIGIDVGHDTGALNQRFHDQVPPGALTIYSAFFLASPICHPNSLGIGHGIFWDSVHFQDPPPVREKWLNLFYTAMENCSHVVSVDTNTINWVRASRATLAHKFSYIPNFVDTGQFQVSAGAKTGEDKVVVLYPRRLYRPRGFWLLAELVPYFIEKYPQVEFHFVGKADEAETKAARKLEEQYRGRVRWYHLNPDEMHTTYEAADIVLIPTVESEGTSLSCIEAMACGKAIIATNVGGLPELVTDGHNGLLIEPTAASLREAIERLITDPDLRKRLATTAREVSLAYDIEIWRSRWCTILQSVLPKTPPPETGKRRLFVHPDAEGVTWKRMKQRPHHLFRALVEAGENAVFANDESTAQVSDDLPGLLQVGKQDSIEVDRPILYIYHTYSYQDISRYRNPVILYDILDDPKIHEASDANTPRNDNYLHYHEKLLKDADVVITSSRLLLDRYRASRADIILVPNGVWPEDFQAEETPRRPEDLPESTGPVVGYYGAVAEWFDFELVSHAAKARPDCTFVLIGLTNRQADIDTLTRNHSNVHYLGEKPYEELPKYLAHFDVAIIPFVVNEITNAVSPVKLFEYAAGGKPIVTTAFAEVRQYSEVLIATNQEDFVQKLEEARSRSRNPEHAARMRQFAKENSWRDRVERILSALNK